VQSQIHTTVVLVHLVHIPLCYRPALAQRGGRRNRLALYPRTIDLEPVRRADGVNQHLHYQTGTIFLDWRTLNTRLQTQMAVTRSGSRSIPRPSSVICVQNVLLVPTTSDLISALIPTNVHSYVLYVGKLSRVNTIENATKDFIQERRSSSAKESSNKAANGVVAVVLPALMHWGGISARKRAAYASNHCSTKKPLSGNVCGKSNECKI
jgi:hypothetical protein